MTRNKKQEFILSIENNTCDRYSLIWSDYLNEPIIEMCSGVYATPLYYACKRQKLNLLTKLLECKTLDVNSFSLQTTRRGTKKSTALYEACKLENIDCVKLLLSHHNVNVNLGMIKIKNESQIHVSHTTPLMKCCKGCKRKNIFDCAELLLAHPNINVNADYSKSESPLEATIIAERDNLVIKLLKKEATLPIENMGLFKQWSPWCQNWKEIIPLLPYRNVVSNQFIENCRVFDPLTIYLKHHSKICNLKKVEGRNRVLCNFSSSERGSNNDLFIDLLIEKIAPKFSKVFKAEHVNKGLVQVVTNQLLYNEPVEYQNIKQCIEILFLIHDTEMLNEIRVTALTYLKTQFREINYRSQTEKINNLILGHDNSSVTSKSLVRDLSNHNYSKSIYEDIYSAILPQFYNNPKSYPDIEIEFESGKKLQCHKSILAASVPFFESYFNGNWEIEPFPDETEFIIYYCYHASIPSESFDFSNFPNKTLITIMKKAHEYQWDELTKVIGNYVIIDKENFWEILDMVELYMESEGFRPILKYLALVACVYKKVLLVEGKREKLPKILMGEIISCFSNDFNF